MNFYTRRENKYNLSDKASEGFATFIAIYL